MATFGTNDGDAQDAAVETIEVWYSARRRAWFVERLDVEGSQIGLSCRYADEDEAVACIAEWLRAHAGSRLMTCRQNEHYRPATSPRQRAA